MSILANLINLSVTVLTLLVFVNVILSYFLDPYHPTRQALDRLVEPFLAPIRRVVPPMGGLDFSPMILLLAIQIIGQLLVSLVQ